MGKIITGQNKPFKYLTVGFLLLLPAFYYWFAWIYCKLEGSTDYYSLPCFYKFVPKSFLGLSIHQAVVVFLVAALAAGVKEKMRQRTRWYKTNQRIKLLISVSLALLLYTVMQMMM